MQSRIIIGVIDKMFVFIIAYNEESCKENIFFSPVTGAVWPQKENPAPEDAGFLYYLTKLTAVPSGQWSARGWDQRKQCPAPRQKPRQCVPNIF